MTLQYDKILFILEPRETAKAAIGKRITVVDYPDGRLSIRYRGVELAYRTSSAGDGRRLSEKEIDKSDEKQPDYDPRGEIGNSAH